MMESLAALPRIALAHLPTPLEPLDRLSESLGGPRIWIKRDDCTGLGSGGNKTRKLEFLIGQAEAEAADTVITFGAVQSNHARQTAAACAKRGLDCHLILARKVPWQDPTYHRLGNVLLDHLFGAHLHLVAPDDALPAFEKLNDELLAGGRKTFVIPVGGSNATGAMGYAVCAAELAAQCDALDLRLSHLVHATSSAGTQAGLLAGFRLLGHAEAEASREVLVHGINVSEPPAEEDALRANIADLAGDALRLAGSPESLDPTGILVDSAYLGEGYGLPTPETLAAVQRLGELEGILLDPVYSGKAMSGLLGKIRQGEFDEASDVVFLHTGGSAALPVYGEALMA